VAGLEGHLELIADGFEPVFFVFFVPHAFVWVDAMGLPALEVFAMGACVLCWCLIVVLFCFFLLLPRALACLSFLWLRPHGLRSSSDNLLLEVALYANLVYSKLESSPSIIE
jgi:hypothetical protein